MRQSIRLGTIRGIPVGAHWSVLMVLVLLVDSLAVGVLPALAGGHPAADYWLTASWMAATFLLGLVVHELAHAVTAQHYGIRVQSVTLWALGGVSTLDDRPRRPRAELMTAIAGPAASIGFAAMCALAAVPARFAGAGLTRTAFVWLAVANLGLAIFNLLPGAPLDGGRILVAVLWSIRGDRDAARRTAARAGSILGLLLAGLGVVLVFGYASYAGLWLVLLGWYLSWTARGELAMAEVTEQLSGVRVVDAMSTPAVCGYSGHAITEFVVHTARLCPHRAYPVTDIDGRFAGVVTVARLAAVPPERRVLTRLAEVMIPAARLRAVRPDERLLDVLGFLGAPGGLLVVLDQDRPCGVLNAGDVTRLVGVAQLGVLPAGHTGAPV